MEMDCVELVYGLAPAEGLCTPQGLDPRLMPTD